ncbi:hypothetical protein CERZMDRAFT_97374 [Cercospora zeae-maydis SCOH1-5]|uniref:AB hydrolase-1 domain-containing protein n=1 Tax=Cercospora zeae-maydis SCOH1-5 TaxID=717836 RepID=A0A6A6FHE5_9PEZI|nr:hypothetical protein CERZMDRAFT_97374 [Cercospora zeae-maydis SCOH1-5]
MDGTRPIVPAPVPTLAEQIEARRLSLQNTLPPVPQQARPPTEIPPASEVTLIFVLDSFYSASHWIHIHAKLTAMGYYDIVTVSPASTQPVQSPPKSLRDDSNMVHLAALNVMAKGKDAVIIAHGYGGTAANNTLQGLDVRSRTEAGATTCVRGIIFITAMPLMTGMTVLQQFGGKLLDCHILEANDEFIFCGPPGPVHWLFNDVLPLEGEYWAGNLLFQSYRAYSEATTHAAYEVIPSVYLRCHADRAFPHARQNVVVQNARKANAIFQVHELPAAGHSPFLGVHEDALAEFIHQKTDLLRNCGMQWFM